MIDVEATQSQHKYGGMLNGRHPLVKEYDDEKLAFNDYALSGSFHG